MLLERPLSARSVIASLLLGMHPPRMPGARLVQWCGAFGIAEGTARVALSRMVDRGELVASAGTYELAGSVRGRQRTQDWSLTPTPDRLGRWVAPRRGPARGARRGRSGGAARTRSAGCGTPRVARAAGSVPTTCHARRARPPRGRSPRRSATGGAPTPEQDAVALAAHLFDPAAWATRARALRDHLEVATESLARAEAADLAHAFEVGAAALAHVRADPLLPPALCAQPWPGHALRDAYAQYQRSFGRAVREWFRAGA